MDMYDHLGELLEEFFHRSMDYEQKYIAKSQYKDITSNDMHILAAIGADSEINMTALALKLHVTVGTLTIAINNLVKKGYVVRKKGAKDRRVVLVVLTDQGREALAFLEEMMHHVGEVIQTEIDEVQCLKLTRILERLLETINASVERMREAEEDG